MSNKRYNAGKDKMNKKAQGQGILIFLLIGVIVVVIFALIAVPVAKVFDDIIDELKLPKHFGTSNTSVQGMEQVQNLATPVFDQLIFIIMIAVILGTLGLAIFSDFHPVTLGMFIIAIILAVIISGMLANVYDEVQSNPELSDKADEFKFTNVIMGKQFPIIILIVGVLGVIIMMAKRGRLVLPV